MKKLFLTLNVVIISFFAFNQTIVRSKVDPKISNYHLFWDEFDNQGYRLRIFKKDLNGVFDEIENIETNNNYFRLNASYFNSNKNYYRIEGKSNNSLIDVSEDDVENIKVYYPGDDFHFMVCDKMCNSDGYAWFLISWGIGIVQDENFDGVADVDEDGNYILHDSGRRYLRMSDNYIRYQNLDEGLYSEFYMAMTPERFEQYKIQWRDIYEPHVTNVNNTSLVTEVDEFDRDVIRLYGYFGVNDGFKTPEGFNFIGSNPYLVKKSALRFNWMDDNRTSELYYNDNLCSMPLTGNVAWIGTFNNHMDEYDNLINSNPDINLYANELMCQGNNGVDVGIFEEIIDERKFDHDNFIDCVEEWIESDFSIDLDDCYQSAIGVNPGSPTVNNNFMNGLIRRVYIDHIDGSYDNTTELNLNQKTETYVPNNLNIEKGLNRLTFILKGGEIIPFVFESSETKITNNKISDIVSLDILSNPLTNNNLKVEIFSDYKINYNLKVISLDGNILHDLNDNLNGISKNISNFNINKKNYAFNQIRVQLLFEDGSSMEKIVSFQN
ncbi:MAG: hypothetical protein HYU67_10315 [Flavobacteriia bacterium]|nr:hypothetical protein [Flavobacteriia bacterium]